MIWITIGQNEINQAEKFCFVNIDKTHSMIYVEICKFSSEQKALHVRALRMPKIFFWLAFFPSSFSFRIPALESDK